MRRDEETAGTGLPPLAAWLERVNRAVKIRMASYLPPPDQSITNGGTLPPPPLPGGGGGGTGGGGGGTGGGGPTPQPTPIAPTTQLPAIPLGPPGYIPAATRTYNAHFTQLTAGAPAGHELRFIPTIPNPFTILAVEINPISNVAIGTFLDVLISNDTDTTQTATPSGSSIFGQLANAIGLTTPDGDIGLQLPLETDRIVYPNAQGQAGQTLKLHSYFKAPALGLASFNVTITWLEWAAAPVTTTTQPPPAPAPAPVPQPAPGPGGTTGGGGTPTPGTTFTYLVQIDYTAPPLARVTIIESNDPSAPPGTVYVENSGFEQDNLWLAAAAGTLKVKAPNTVPTSLVPWVIVGPAALAPSFAQLLSPTAFTNA